VVGAVRDVNAGSVAGGSGGRMTAGCGACEDELQRQEIAVQRRSKTRCDLSLVLSANHSHCRRTPLLVRPRSCWHQVGDQSDPRSRPEKDAPTAQTRREKVGR